MKVICDGIDLAVAANTVLRGISGKALNHILEGVKIIAKNDTLTLCSTDLEVFIEKIIKADIKIEGEVVIPARLFSEYLKKVNEGQVLISLDNNKLKLKTGDSDCEFSCLNAGEYPSIVKIQSQNKIELNVKTLKDIINKNICCVLMDDSRPVLKGILFNKELKNLTTVSLDGFRLCKVETNLETAGNDSFKYIVPARALDEIRKLIDDKLDEKVALEFNSNYIQFNTNGTNFVSKLITGDFINYSQIIPTEFNSNVIVNKKNLELALERAGLLARVDRNNLVNFYIKEGLITIKSNNEVGNIEEKVTTELKGKDIEIAFNVKYFSDALRNISSEFIKISFNSSISPCIITGINNESFLFLILPVRIV